MRGLNIVLHIGHCPKQKDQTLPAFQSEGGQEVVFDIYGNVAPDIIGGMTDMSKVEAGSTDAEALCEQVEAIRSVATVNFANPGGGKAGPYPCSRSPAHAVDLVGACVSGAGLAVENWGFEDRRKSQKRFG